MELPRVLRQHYSTCDVGTDCLGPCQVCDSQPPLIQRGDHFLSPLHFILEFLVWMCAICTHRNFHLMSFPSQLESHPKSHPEMMAGELTKTELGAGFVPTTITLSYLGAFFLKCQPFPRENNKLVLRRQRYDTQQHLSQSYITFTLVMPENVSSLFIIPS
jgi:hypothetical protein